jgi:hypothetical protein
MCGDYDACSAGKWWNNETAGQEDASTKLECKLVNPEEKANECKAAVEAIKKEHMGCFCKLLLPQRNKG